MTSVNDAPGASAPPQLKQIGISRSFFISIAVHLVLLLLFSFTILKSPFNNIQEPIIVNIESSDSLAGVISERMDNNTSAKNSPHLQERVTKSVDRTAVPDKTTPRDNRTVSSDEGIREKVKETQTTDSRRDLNRENSKNNKVADDNTRKLDNYLEEEASHDRQNDELNKVNEDIDKALDDSESSTQSVSSQGSTKGDPLSDAEWSAKPRKTVYFPDIQSRIPAKYKKKGMGYSLTARIAFDKNGLAIRVDIIKSSGEANIDSVFFSELKKIRVEAITDDRVDEITKTFTLSLK